MKFDFQKVLIKKRIEVMKQWQNKQGNEIMHNDKIRITDMENYEISENLFHNSLLL